MFEKLNKYRIQERMARAFMTAVMIPIAASVLMLIFLILVAVQNSDSTGASCHYYGFHDIYAAWEGHGERHHGTIRPVEGAADRFFQR